MSDKNSEKRIISSFFQRGEYKYFYKRGYNLLEDLIFVNSYLFHKLFGNFCMYNNEAAKEVVESNLYFKSSSETVEEDKKFPPNFWSSSKIQAISIQNNPFILCDIDALPWEKSWAEFDEDFLFYARDLDHRNKSPLNPIYRYYTEGISKLREISDFKPLRGVNLSEERPKAEFDIYNFGVIGCNNPALLNPYLDQLHSILSHKKELEEAFKTKREQISLCVTLEQLLLSKVVYEHGFSVKTVYKDIGGGMRLPERKFVPLTHLMSLKNDFKVRMKVNAYRRYIESNDKEIFERYGKMKIQEVAKNVLDSKNCEFQGEWCPKLLSQYESELSSSKCTKCARNRIRRKYLNLIENELRKLG